MRRYIYLAFALIVSLCVGCAKDGEQKPVNEPAELTLCASSLEVVVGPDSYVDFSVMLGDEDVTSKAKIYFEGEGKSLRLDEPRFLIEERVEHTFYATYDNMMSEKVVVRGQLTLELVPDASPVVVGAESVVNFKVLASGEEVTDQAKIYHRLASQSRDESERIASSYIMESVGEHLFYVEYSNIESDDLLIYGVESMIERVADSNPDQYEDFKRKILTIQATSTECTWCPHMIKAIEESAEESSAVAESMIHTAAHGTLGSDEVDPMMCEASVKVIETMGMNYLGYPALNFAMSPVSGFTLGNPYSPSDSDGKVEVLKGQIASTVESLLKFDAVTALSGSAQRGGDIVAVRADVKVATEGQYYIGAWLIEDGIEAEQYNAKAFPDYDFSHHNNAICATYPAHASDDLFVKLGGVDTQRAKSDHTFYCEFDLSKAETLQDIDKCQVVVFVYDMLGTMVDNAIVFGVGESQAIEYK